MNEHEIKEMEELADDAKTIAEHSSLILTYRQTGNLNREDAIRKYKEFNTKHPEYCAGIEAWTTAFYAAIKYGFYRMEIFMNLVFLNPMFTWLG